MKKVIAVLLVLSMTLGLSAEVFAFGGLGGGGGGDPYGIMGASGSIGRVARIWEYKGGGLIAIDDFTRGMKTTYVNGRPVYATITLPPNMETLTSISFHVYNPSNPSEVLLPNATLDDISLLQFFGHDNDADGNQIPCTTLEEWLRDHLGGLKPDGDDEGTAGDDFTDEEIGQIAAAVRDQVAQRIAAYGVAGIDSDNSDGLLSQSEVIYQYDKATGQISKTLRTATDDEGKPLTDPDDKVLWTEDTYQAGLLVERTTHIYAYKLDANNELVRDPITNKPELDKTNLIKIREQFEYADNDSWSGDSTGKTQLGMVMIRSKVVADENSSDGLIKKGDVLSKVENDEFGRAAQEFGIARIDTLSATPLVMGLLTEHVYNNANGLEKSTINYSYADANVVAMRITDLSYNGANQLAGTSTTLILKHFVKSATDDNEDGDTTDPGEAAVTEEYDEFKGNVGSSQIYYNSMGQRYFVDSIDVDIDAGTSSILRTYYAYNRELIAFSRNVVSANEPDPFY